MDPPREDGLDNTSIQPVSSLRSRFEGIVSSKPKPPPPPVKAQPSPPKPFDRPSEQGTPDRQDGRMSLDIPRRAMGPSSPGQAWDIPSAGSRTPTARVARTLTPAMQKPRPLSMGPLSPRSPPRVAISSPSSPPKSGLSPTFAPIPAPLTPQHTIGTADARSVSPPRNGHFRLGSRSPAPGIEARQAMFMQPASTPTNTTDPTKPRHTATEPSKPRPTSSVGPPPPVNRAGKPKVAGRTSPVQKAESPGKLAPASSKPDSAHDASPFSTPPSSDEGTPPPIPQHSKPNKQTVTNPQDSYFMPPPPRRVNTDSVAATSPLPIGVGRSSTTRRPQKPLTPVEDDFPENRPQLPSRRPQEAPAEQTSAPRAEAKRLAPAPPPARRSMDASRALDTPRSQSVTADQITELMPPPKRTQTEAIRSPKPPPLSSSAPSAQPTQRIASRASVDLQRPAARALSRNVSTATAAYDSDDQIENLVDKATPTLSNYPDSSRANRRPPCFTTGATEIPTRYDTKLFAVCGEFVCTTGYLTRVWSLVTGEQLMSISHGDTVKVTAVAFKPSKDVEDEGKRLWLATNIGELQEVDIPSQRVVKTAAHAHSRREVIKIFRYASEMWSLDETGALHMWPPDESGSPNLDLTPNSFKVPKGHSYSMVVGIQLWHAVGKEIRIFQRSSDNRGFAQVLTKPLSQANVGEVTSGAMLSSQPDRVYFGHNDGKVTIYSREDYSCLGVTNVSLYKISSLVGVGDYLWAGYNTGMMYVYDTTCLPWLVQKDWKAHEGPIAGIIADRTSIWKLDRLQVVSLGTDNMLRVWDGMLKDDWLEAQLQSHDSEFCSFREITATVMTWNAGASKPSHLRQDQQDNNFFSDFILSHDYPPDIFVFGFQELVDLEDKRVTAKSFFKSKKKVAEADAAEPEHMSRQYRLWLDHLQNEITTQLPGEDYTLLHTANLVGLFTCIFIRSRERQNIRDVHASQVKLGMGGALGNKGALIVRLILDDSSVCFINCHLAAGQTHTAHRNNDIAGILESSSLPPQRNTAARARHFVGGGDGSMVLDHEICILNGDLNYRIESMPRDTVVRTIQQQGSAGLQKLFERDQLLLSRKRNPGFRLRAFAEQPLTFAPTYKYDVGTDNYDTSEKKRAPAWCDRVLYRGKGRIKQTEYRRWEVRVSDHRPVTARFVCRVKSVDDKKRSKILQREEQAFEDFMGRVGEDIKLDYLVNVFGLSTREAKRLLSQ